MMFQAYRLPIVVEPALSKAVASVIWMHGLGASGHDFEDFVPVLQKYLKTPTRFILPHAPELAVTVNQGYPIPAWYDIRSPDLAREHDEVGLLKSVDYIHYLVSQEIKKGMVSEKIILAGFSQGGVMSLISALSYPQALAGCLVLSSYLTETPKIAAQFKPINQTIPILWLHGQQDPLVPYTGALQAVERLRTLQYVVEFKGYPVAHTVSPQAITDITQWMESILHRGAKA